MKSKLLLEDIKKYGYMAAESKFYEMISDEQYIDYVSFSQETMDILCDSEFSIKLHMAYPIAIYPIGCFEWHNRKKNEKDIRGFVPVLCGYQIKINNDLDYLELEVRLKC